MTMIHLEMDPFPGPCDLSKAAVIIIDMQCDFIEPGGFASMLGNDVSKLQVAIEPCKAVLDAARHAGMLVIHTREGHRPDLRDVHPHKLYRGGKASIGTDGPKGRILIRGQVGHDIIPDLYPQTGEPQSINQVCVFTTIREANDRGFHCIAISDACGSFFPEFHKATLDMIVAQGGIFGSVTDSTKFIAAMENKSSNGTVPVNNGP